MLTKEQAISIRKAIWNDSAAYGPEHTAFCEEHGLEESEVREFLDSAVAYCERQEDAFRAQAALDLSVTIETNQQKRDGSFVTQFGIATNPENYARLMGMRGKALRMKLYDPQTELPLEYGRTAPETPDEQVPMGGLLPEPVEVEVEDEADAEEGEQ
ncbi:MAG: hypothetical protein IJ781_08025 [Atopobiaceae bacterium]|nr:hypothetical protein [Atopobiaceae bacterium]